MCISWISGVLLCFWLKLSLYIYLPIYLSIYLSVYITHTHTHTHKHTHTRACCCSSNKTWRCVAATLPYPTLPCPQLHPSPHSDVICWFAILVTCITLGAPKYVCEREREREKEKEREREGERKGVVGRGGRIGREKYRSFVWCWCVCVLTPTHMCACSSNQTSISFTPP